MKATWSTSSQYTRKSSSWNWTNQIISENTSYRYSNYFTTTTKKGTKLEQIKQRQPQPIELTPDQQEYHVDFDDDEELQGATTGEPEELLQGEEEEEPQETMWKWNVPQKILKKPTIDEIRGYQEEEELIGFTARNSKKEIRDRHINPGYKDRIDSLKDWTRMVFLTKTHTTRVPSDGRYQRFDNQVKKI